MIRNYIVADKIGLHARPASLLVNEASKHSEEINILYKGKKMTLKSILGIMALGVPYGEEFGIEVVDNEEEIFTALEKVLVEQKLI